MQITVGTQDGRTFQTEIEESAKLVGKEIGDEFDGGIVGLSGYTLKITGGSDRSGFPMRETIEGSERKRVLIEEGSGIDVSEDGVRERKSVRGKRVSSEIQQLNTTVVEEGSKSVEELLGEDEE
ncbi:30S ribosomal protein S6 [Nanohaloarchaea archaeon SG9]|nr:30S ribosomal protein S6 [Nanohaloarchaea archaeon SG9]